MNTEIELLKTENKKLKKDLMEAQRAVHDMRLRQVEFFIENTKISNQLEGLRRLIKTSEEAGNSLIKNIKIGYKEF